MTPVSRIPPSRVAGSAVRSASRLRLLVWHVGCCVLGEGCLYVAPIEMIPVNSPPVIQDPADLFNEKVVIADYVYLKVVASDADEDELYFGWTGVPADVEIPPDPPFPDLHNGETWWTSIYKVPRDLRLDGRSITVLVSDGEPADAVEVEWLLTVEN